MKVSVRESKRGFKGVKRELYNKINKTFNKHIFLELLKGDVFKAPSRVGYFSLIKVKSPNLVDPISSKKYGRKIFYDNFHSDGYAVKIYWDKRNANFRNKIYWRFKLVRSNTRLGPNSIKNHIYKHGVGDFLEKC